MKINNNSRYQVERYCADRWVVTKPSMHKALQNDDKFRVIAVLDGRTAMYESEEQAYQVAECENSTEAKS